MAGINRASNNINETLLKANLQGGIKCVFISYQQKDKEPAKKVAEYLMDAGIDIYFDELDKELRIYHEHNDPKKVTESICKGINKSSHMMVVISPNTVHSSWVPFEIGYGYEKTDVRVLCLKGIAVGSLPEYIRTAPVIRDIYDLNNRLSEWLGKPKNALMEKSRLMSEHSDKTNVLSAVMDTLIVDSYT